MDYIKKILANPTLQATVRRAVKTFGQAAVAQWIVMGSQATKIALTSAVAAGLSAAWTIIVTPVIINHQADKAAQKTADDAAAAQAFTDKANADAAAFEAAVSAAVDARLAAANPPLPPAV